MCHAIVSQFPEWTKESSAGDDSVQTYNLDNIYTNKCLGPPRVININAKYPLANNKDAPSCHQVMNIFTLSYLRNYVQGYE